MQPLVDPSTRARSGSASPRGDAVRAVGTSLPLTRRRIVVFVGLSYAPAWLTLAVLIAVGADIGDGGASAAFTIAMCAPSLVAGSLWLWRPRERRPSRPPHWWAASLGLVLGAAVPALPAVVLHLKDLSALVSNAADVAAGVGGVAGVVGMTLVAGPLSEELGWRGYLQPRVRRVLGPLPTALVIGVTWSLWHLPLFFLPGTTQHESGLLSLSGILLLVGFVPFSLVILFLVERLRGGVLAAIAAHAGFNAAGALMPTGGPAASVLELAILLTMAAAVALVYRRDP